MGVFLKKHSEFVLIGLSLLFLGIVVVSFFWGIATLFSRISSATTVQTSDLGATASFDIKGAANLDLRGLVK